MRNTPKSIQTHRFCVLPPLKNHPSQPIGFVYSPLWKITHHNPSVLCTPPFGKSPIQTHRFYVLPPLENHPSKPIGFMYSPLWKITVFGGRLFRQIQSTVYTMRLELSRQNSCSIFIKVRRTWKNWRKKRKNRKDIRLLCRLKMLWYDNRYTVIISYVLWITFIVQTKFFGHSDSSLPSFSKEDVSRGMKDRKNAKCPFLCSLFPAFSPSWEKNFS